MVRLLARFALSFGRMNSILGRNSILISIRYGFDTYEVKRENINRSCVRTFYESLVSVELRLKVHLIFEVVMVNDRVMTLDGFELYKIPRN